MQLLTREYLLEQRKARCIFLIWHQITGQVGGFIISPTKEASEAFLGQLEGFKYETNKFSQGGLKVLVSNFFKA